MSDDEKTVITVVVFEQKNIIYKKVKIFNFPDHHESDDEKHFQRINDEISE